MVAAQRLASYGGDVTAVLIDVASDGAAPPQVARAAARALACILIRLGEVDTAPLETSVAKRTWLPTKRLVTPPPSIEVRRGRPRFET